MRVGAMRCVLISVDRASIIPSVENSGKNGPPILPSHLNTSLLGTTTSATLASTYARALRILRHVRPPPGGNLTRPTRIARRHVQRGILCEEMPRPQQHRHRLRRHDGEVLWRGKVRQPKRVPEHDVRVVDGGGGVRGDPGGEVCVCGVGGAGGLRDVTAGRMDLGVGVWWRGLVGGEAGLSGAGMGGIYIE